MTRPAWSLIERDGYAMYTWRPGLLLVLVLVRPTLIEWQVVRYIKTPLYTLERAHTEEGMGATLDQAKRRALRVYAEMIRSRRRIDAMAVSP